MTSAANNPNVPVPNQPAPASAPSYATAAGATKKPGSTPLIATGSNPPPPVVVGSSAAAPPQNAKPASASPINGRPSIPPAVPTISAPPAVVHGTVNGGPDHSRRSSLTFSANGPSSLANGGPAVAGAKGNIRFGFDSSPAVNHSSPQPSGANPIPIPGAPRVPSPSHSPAPIPQPTQTGGRPPSGLVAGAIPPTFGSPSGDGDRHMRQHSVPPSNPALAQNHMRKESTHSMHGDMNNQGMPVQGPGRGGYQPQAGRGRGGYNAHNSPYTNNANLQMGFPPANNFNRGQGRAMPAAFQPGRGQMGYPNSPQPGRASPSPALTHSIPATPIMAGANLQPQMPAPNMPYHYPAPQSVMVPPPLLESSFPRPYKKKFARPNQERFVPHPPPVGHGEPPSQQLIHDQLQRQRRFSKRGEGRWTGSTDSRAGSGSRPHMTSERPPLAAETVSSAAQSAPVFHMDLSPESGNFERLLTAKQQGYPFAQAYDHFPRGPMMPAYPMGYMPQPQANTQPYQQQFVPHYHPVPAPSNMSRSPSQPERPNSSTGQPNQTVIASGSQNPQGKPPVVSGTNFVRPKGGPITIKKEDGTTVDFSSVKAPASQAQVIQQSKTPPVVASTPPPPPKSTTPSHVRTDSQATSKSKKEVQDELREKVIAAMDGNKEKEEAAAAAKAAEEKAQAEAAAKAEAEAAEKAAAEAAKKAAEEARLEAEKKAKEEAAAEEARKKKEEDDEWERQAREMEEEEARREEAEKAYLAKKAIEKEAQKKREAEEAIKKREEEEKYLKEQEAEADRLEEERERRRREADATGVDGPSVRDQLAASKTGQPPPIKTEPAATKVDDVTEKLGDLSITPDVSKPTTPTEAPTSAKTPTEKPTEKQRAAKPAPLNIVTKPVENAQPSAALQSLKSARFLTIINESIYPPGIHSPNPALNSAVAKKGRTFKYDANFLLQFQKVFTEQPSTEFHQQVKALIGDGDGSRSASARTPAGSGSGRQNSRSGGAPFNAMGSFGAPAGHRTLPPNTTSTERFNMSNGISPRPNVPLMASFNRPVGSFAAPGMARTPSSQNMGNMPGSPRVGSKKGGSRRVGAGEKESANSKNMPLTQGMEIKPITTSATGWKPSSVGNRPAANAPTPSSLMDPEMVQRKVKAALNKMTPEKFDKISDQILDIAAQSKHEADGRTLRQVIQLTFEKATDEAHWASMYAKFCKRMLEMMSPEIRDENIRDKNGQVVSGGALFRKYLLNRCQEEFERGWKINISEGKDEGEDNNKSLEAAMMSDEYYIAAAAKRRGLGLVQFIGELYKLGMLTERIMHECVKKLVDYTGTPEEAEIESLSKLLRTIGGNLDATDRGKQLMDVYFDRIQTIVDLPDLPSRLKFMLMDVIDLRRVNWVSKETNKGPKTLEEVRAEAEAQAAAKAAEAARTSQRGGAGGRPAMGRGDARNFSSNFNQPATNQVGIDDLRRLKGSASRTSSQGVSLGPTSMFSSRSNSGRRLGPSGSLGRAGEDSAASSRTGTPPTQATHANQFSLLATMESEHPTSPPSTAASPSMSKVVPDSSTGGDDKKESE